MAKLPLDVKAVLEAATDLERARQMPVHVALFVDDAAPGELVSFARECFQSTSPQARLTERGWGLNEAIVEIGTDCAVLVAGESAEAGPMAAKLLSDGVPCAIVTLSPCRVAALAEESNAAIADGDLIAPERATDWLAEPYEFTSDRAERLRRRLGEWVVAVFREKRLAFALSYPFVREPLARDSVNATAVQNAAIGLVPFIPGADMPLMTMNQAKMVLQIAAAYGLEVGPERWKELLAVTGGAFAGRQVARRAAAAVPVLGAPIKLGVAFGGTQAMGRAAAEYFARVAEGTYELPHGKVSGGAEEVASRARETLEPVAQSLKAVASDALTRAKEAAADAADALKPHAHRVAERAVPLAKDAAQAAYPYVRRAADEVVPLAQRAVQAVSPYVRDAVAQAVAGASKRER